MVLMARLAQPVPLALLVLPVLLAHKAQPELMD
jgi:hypothetical protein